MARIIKAVHKPHDCLAELAGFGPELWPGSIVECSCGKRFIRRDSQRDGLYWQERPPLEVEMKTSWQW